jgi:hypothetical protein
MDTLLSEIEAFRATHGLSEWKFGDLALRDRHFIPQLRAGREIRRRTEAKVRTFIATYRPEAAEAA